MCICHLDVSVSSQLVIPQDDFSVFSSSGQQSATPHLTHTENTALVTFDLPTDLKRCTKTRTGESHLSSPELKSLSGNNSIGVFSVLDSVKNKLESFNVQFLQPPPGGSMSHRNTVSSTSCLNRSSAEVFILTV